MRCALRLSVVAFALATSNCSVAVSEGATSPWQTGIDLRVSPEIKRASSDDLSLHATAAYERSFAAGGHENDLHLGGQIRFTPPQSRDPGKKFWVGGEGSYSRRSAVVTDPLIRDPDDAGVTHGFRFSGLFGVPVLVSARGSWHFYTSAGVMKYGGAGPSFRFGLEFQPASARR
jgi:hypothetical protein